MPTGFSCDLKFIVNPGASAALAIAQRQGLGKLRHIRVQWFWVKERTNDQDFDLVKVHGKSNPVDLMTRHLSVEESSNFLDMLSCEVRGDRAERALTIAKVSQRGVVVEGIVLTIGFMDPNA